LESLRYRFRTVISSSGLVVSIAAAERGFIQQHSVYLPSPFVQSPIPTVFQHFHTHDKLIRKHCYHVWFSGLVKATDKTGACQPQRTTGRQKRRSFYEILRPIQRFHKAEERADSRFALGF
jgi:hypothetical protein